MYSEVPVEQVSRGWGGEESCALYRTTHKTENIMFSFPQLGWRTVMKNVKLYLFMWREDVVQVSDGRETNLSFVRIFNTIYQFVKTHLKPT